VVYHPRKEKGKRKSNIENIVFQYFASLSQKLLSHSDKEKTLQKEILSPNCHISSDLPLCLEEQGPINNSGEQLNGS